MRVALILPARRLGTWHANLAERLGGSHELAIFVDESAPAYPLPMRAWLTVEHLLYRDRQGAPKDLVNKPLSPLQTMDPGAFEVVIDLAERPQPQPNAVFVRYDDSPDSVALLDRLLAHQTPHLSVVREGLILAESFPAIDDKFRLSRGLRIAGGRCISLIERALQSPRARPDGRVTAAPSRPGSLPDFIRRFATNKAANMVGRLTHAPQWSVALRSHSGPFLPVTNEPRHFYADPFLYEWSGRTFLFVEDYSDATKKAVISAAEIVDGRPACAPVPILDRPYHLSYPLVFAEAGEIFMLPETAGNSAIELYRAEAFPWEWRLASTLIEGMALADATLLFHQDRWWLFACMGQHGTTDHDELFVFYSDKLAGPWRPHAENPVKSDCRSARPAGRVVRRGDRLFRPAQDCERAYGSGIVWHEITELTPARFAEIEVARVTPPYELGLDGLHHFDEAGHLQAIDFRTARSLGPRRYRERMAMSYLGSGLDRAL